MNKEAMRSLLIFLIAWVVLATIVTYALRRTSKSHREEVHFDVPIYAGAKDVQQEGSAESRWVRVTYQIDAKPPATQVTEYYQQQLPARGWLPSSRTRDRAWEHRRGPHPVDVLWRQWLSKDELLRFDLYLTYLRGKEALPGLMTVKIEVGRHFPMTHRENKVR